MSSEQAVLEAHLGEGEVDNMAKFYKNYDTAFELYSVDEIRNLYGIIEQSALKGDKASQEEFEKLKDYMADNTARFRRLTLN